MKKISLRVIVAIASLLTIGSLAAPAAHAAAVPHRSGSFGHSAVAPMGSIAIIHHAAHVGSYTDRLPAGAGSWSSQASEPVLYNYGLLYWGPVINPPSGIPSTAVITNICWTWNYTYPHPASGIWMYLTNSYNPGYAIVNTSGNELGCSTLDNGQPASQQFEFGFGSPGGSSGYYPPILPPASPSGPSTISVSYTY